MRGAAFWLTIGSARNPIADDPEPAALRRAARHHPRSLILIRQSSTRFIASLLTDHSSLQRQPSLDPECRMLNPHPRNFTRPRSVPFRPECADLERWRKVLRGGAEALRD